MMEKGLIWKYNESFQVGADYTDEKTAIAYDDRINKIRDAKSRAKDYIALLSIDINDVVLDFGCGTGSITTEIAKVCRKVIAIDVSTTMLNIAKAKAAGFGIDNITFVEAGFLSYKHEGEFADKVITTAAFHHLPDFWKVIALKQINSIMKKDGKLLLSDVVFSFEISDYISAIESFIDGIRMRTDDEFAKDAIMHIREEFSTFDWLMDVMMRKTGYLIDKKLVRTNTNIDYICKKVI